ncbi:MAG TPA: hypothetical protein VNB29_02655 [Chthoniobacterales bacterium]|jgi:hypothetical protein|nr:hypothetical protein [Chthoniobacterales bacterium]
MKLALYLLASLGLAGMLGAKDVASFAGTYHGILRTSGKDVLIGRSDATFNRQGLFRTDSRFWKLSFRKRNVFLFHPLELRLLGTWHRSGRTIRFSASSATVEVEGFIRGGARRFYLSISQAYSPPFDTLPPTPTPLG